MGAVVTHTTGQNAKSERNDFRPPVYFAIVEGKPLSIVRLKADKQISSKLDGRTKCEAASQIDALPTLAITRHVRIILYSCVKPKIDVFWTITGARKICSPLHIVCAAQGIRLNAPSPSLDTIVRSLRFSQACFLLNRPVPCHRQLKTAVPFSPYPYSLFPWCRRREGRRRKTLPIEYPPENTTCTS